MSNSKNLSGKIPETSHTFEISVEGEITKKQFTGEFACKIPTRKDTCMIDKHRAMLNGDIAEQLTVSTIAFHHKISYLRYTLTEMPKWWRDADLGYGLYDNNVVSAVYDAVLEFERQWLKEIWGEEGLKRFEVGGDESEQQA